MTRKTGPAGATGKAAALALCAVLAWSAAAAAGEPAALDLQTLSGDAASLQDLRGQIVVLNFWATWCVPCRHEMPLLAEARQRYRDRGVEVVGASADAPERRREVERFVKKQRLDFPIWVGATTADMERLGLGEALPATAILDRDGGIAFTILGPVVPGDLAARLDWLLGDRTEPPPAARLDRFAGAVPGGPDAHERHSHEGDAHDHAGEEEHAHGGVGIEGASLVPS